MEIRDTALDTAAQLNDVRVELNGVLAQLKRAEAKAARTEASNVMLLAQADEDGARIVALEAEIGRLKAGLPAGTGDQAKEIEQLKADKADIQKTLERVRTMTPPVLQNAFVKLADADQAEVIRLIANFDDAEPGAYDIYKVKWIEILYRKIHNPRHRDTLRGRLAEAGVAPKPTATRDVVAGSLDEPPPERQAVARTNGRAPAKLPVPPRPTDRWNGGM
jgi:hypothetical protein